MLSLVGTMRFIIFGAVCTLATAQQVIQDPIKNFCRRHQHQSCVIDSKLYIDGGLEYFGTSVEVGSQPERNTWLLWGDLSKIGPGGQEVPPLYSNLSKSAEVPTVSGGVLWPDEVNKLFYLYSGEYNNGTVRSFTEGLWYFDTLYNKWDRALSDGSQTQISWPAFGASAITDEGIAYYYGGYLNNRTTPNWSGKPLMLNSLVSYDMNKRTWSNRTDGIRRAEGALQYIPAGDRGMLIYFGGLETSTNGNITYSDMSQIQVYDIANSRWYTQKATVGLNYDMPRRRRGFCAGTVWAKDFSSYNIYIYGGIASDETALGDLYILSLPSFTWIPYPDSQPKDWYGGKAWASCSLINKSQMIVMSGFYTNSSKTACDSKDIGGQHSLLLGQESVEKGNVWRALMPDVVEYRVPSNITVVIGGGTDGKATLTAPASGWATSDLLDGFRRPPYRAVSRSATRSVPTSSASTTPTTTPAPSNPGSSTNIGAIAGGAVGGAIVLIAIFILAFLCLRRRRQRLQNTDNTTTTTQPPPHPLNPATDQKHLSMSQASEMYSPYPQSTPHGSPIPEHNSAFYHVSPQQPQYSPVQQYSPAQAQTYYPPPGGQSLHDLHAELPIAPTPMEYPELSGVRSPKPMRF